MFFSLIFNVFNLLCEVVVFNLGVYNILVEVGGMQVGAVFDFNNFFQYGMLCGNPV